MTSRVDSITAPDGGTFAGTVFQPERGSAAAGQSWELIVAFLGEHLS